MKVFGRRWAAAPLVTTLPRNSLFFLLFFFFFGGHSGWGSTGMARLSATVPCVQPASRTDCFIPHAIKNHKKVSERPTEPWFSLTWCVRQSTRHQPSLHWGRLPTQYGQLFGHTMANTTDVNHSEMIIHTFTLFFHTVFLISVSFIHHSCVATLWCVFWSVTTSHLTCKQGAHRRLLGDQVFE